MQVLVKVGKLEIKQDDLKCLVSQTLTKLIIDSSLTVFKHLNSKLCKSNPTAKKVMIAKTNFTQKIFNNERTEVVLDIFTSQFLVFPVFVGYWTILCFNLERLIIHYYDPLKKNKYLKEILRSLVRFLNHQEQLGNKDRPQTNFQDIVYQKLAISDDFSEEDSALYMLKIIYHLSLNEKSDAKSSDFPNFRIVLLKLLFQYGSI